MITFVERSAIVFSWMIIL